ncbi:hypothetical protein SAMN05660485_00684 [Blastococcus fimeti]|nr:hypothetical protein SAMN05660485_00684 [Blastococcus fimeti]
MNTSELRDELRRDADLAGLPPTDLVTRVAGLRRRSRRRSAAVAGGALAVAVAVAGISALDGVRAQDRGGDSAAVVDLTDVFDPEVAAQEYRATIAGAGAAGSSAIAPESLTEYLPNSQFLARNGVLVTLSDAVVVGHVTSVSPGRGFYVSETDDSVSIEVPFDDPRAMWRTASAEVVVTEVLAGEVTEGTIRVGVGVPPSFDVLEAGLPALGDLVLFLESPSPEYHYEPGTWRLAENGSLLAEIEPDGRLTLPALEPYFADRYLAQNPTLDSLRTAAQQPPRVLPFETLAD